MLKYPQLEKPGPPFSVEEPEVRRLHGARWKIDLLERHDVLASQPYFVDEGVTALTTAVYQLQHARFVKASSPAQRGP